MSKRNPEQTNANDSLYRVLIEPLDDMLARLEIRNWDWLLVGDGSGTSLDHACGWSCVAVGRREGVRHTLAGACSHGTSQFSEIMAVMHGVAWLCQYTKRSRHTEYGRRSYLNVHVLTDNANCRQSAQKAPGERPDAGFAPFWSMFDGFERQGLILHWHHVRRETVGLNAYADRSSRAHRIMMEKHRPGEPIVTGPTQVPELKSVYDFNPTLE